MKRYCRVGLIQFKELVSLEHLLQRTMNATELSLMSSTASVLVIIFAFKREQEIIEC